jgi:RNA polymerase sigma factor (sigma-70 family)
MPEIESLQLPLDSPDSDTIRLDAPHAAEFTRTRADLARWRAGELGAFEDLWRRYYPALAVLVAGRVRSGVEPSLRARLDADDVLQDVAVTVFGKLDQFEYRGPGSMLAWMSAIAERTVTDWLDYWRAGKRHPRAELPPTITRSRTNDAGSTVLLADAGSGPATNAILRERRRRLGTAMATLSPRQHTIVLWRFFGGAEWSEIAREVGAVSAEAVRKECYLQVFPLLAAALADSSGLSRAQPDREQ